MPGGMVIECQCGDNHATMGPSETATLKGSGNGHTKAQYPPSLPAPPPKLNHNQTLKTRPRQFRALPRRIPCSIWSRLYGSPPITYEAFCALQTSGKATGGKRDQKQHKTTK